MQLVNGSRVVIVGGGPAGCLTALHLLRLAAEVGLSLDVTILEARDFNRPGPGGCNKCAGILSSGLLRNLETIGLSLPPDVIQAELDAYVLHLSGMQLTIHRPDPARRIVSIYRGSGPRLGEPPFPHSFDSWLLDQARERGANVRRARAQIVRPGSRPVVATAHEQFEADLVVLATGVNSRAPLDPAWRYRPPRTEIMAQDEVPLPGGLIGDGVHIFFDHPPGLIFGGLIPKGRYANISLLGRKLPPDAVSDFLEGNQLASLLPDGVPVLCGCTPRVAVSAASGYYADRLVVVGDAAITRLYKDGIGAAFTTAEAAARTAIERGISKQDFAAGYRPVCRRIATDNLYGRLLFRLWAAAQRSPSLLALWRKAILAEADLPPAAHLHTRLLWSMFTGDEPYRKIFWLSFSWPALRGLWLGALGANTSL
jgi:flavin-dependent dehydrogenase